MTTSTPSIIQQKLAKTRFGTGWLVYLFVFVFAAIFLLAIRERFYEFSDEGEILQGAKRIAQGQLPYRDFWTFRIPGAYWILAIPFKIFGYDLGVARTFMCVVQAGSVVLLYSLSRRFTSIIWAMGVAGLYLLAIMPIYFIAYHHWLSLDFCLLALWLILTKPHNPAYLFGAGFALAWSIFVVQSNGTYFALALFVGVVATTWLEYHKEGRKKLWGQLVKHLGWLVLGGVVPGVGLVVWLLLNGLFSDFWQAAVVWLLQSNSKFESLAYWQLFPTLNNLLERYNAAWLVLSLPIVLLGIGFGWSLWKRQKENLQARQFFQGYVLLWVAALADLFNAFPRTDVPHMGYGSLIPLVLAAALLSYYLPRLPALFSLLIKVVIISFVVFTLFLNLEANTHILTYSSATRPDYTVHAAKGELLFDDKGDAQRVQALLDDLQAQVKPDDQIFIYPYDAILYIIGNYNNPTWEDLILPVWDSEERVQQIINQLETKKVQYVLDVVATRDAQSQIFDELHNYDWNSFPVQAYINSHYKVLHAYGSYARLLVRNS